jgi:hypothetical protein
MASPASRLSTTPTTDPDFNLTILGWLSEGDCLIFHDDDKYASLFHKCLGNLRTEEQTSNYLEHTRVIHVEVACWPELQNDPTFKYVIRRAESRECTCSLQKRVFFYMAHSKKLPHEYRFTFMRNFY